MPEFQIITGDALQSLQAMPGESVDCCVTSPPYFGLRDYGHAGQLGLEPTPEAYVQAMTEVLREVRRVLKPQGTLWLNIGDSYAGSWGAQGRQGKTGQLAGRSACAVRQIVAAAKRDTKTGSLDRTPGLKAKDLIGIPWRLAFALQADGWWLRCDMIWEKNCMPESVKDRPTRNHEYVFLLSKAERYHCDMKAIEEDGAVAAGTRAAKGANVRSDLKDVNGRPPEYWEYTGKRNKRSVWKVNTQPFKGAHFAVMPEALVEPCILAGCPEGGLVLDPFAGSGTVGAVSLKNFRRFVGIELNPAYAAMATRRISAATPGPALFNQQNRASA